jgi:tRNA dimethylallyltransferase
LRFLPKPNSGEVSPILIVIVGPTAVGKTSVAFDLAVKYGTQIVSADSRQIYKELDIAVAKPSAAQLRRVTHHFVGSVSIHEDYDAARFGDEAIAVIDRIHSQNRYAIVCGGSGLYIKALVEGFDPMPHVPEEVRKRIVESYDANGLEWLQAEVEAGDPDYFEVVDRRNPQRLMRALEVIQSTGLRPSMLRRQQKRKLPFLVVKVGLYLDRAELYKRIDQRVDDMVARGLFAEAEGLFQMRELNALQTVGYQEIFGFLEGKYDRDEAVRLLKRNTRRYAKRQMTWFKKDKEIRWFDPNAVDEIVQYIESSAG